MMKQEQLYSFFGEGNLIYKIFGKSAFSKYSFGRQTKYYSKKVEAEELERSREYFLALKGSRKGERCFVIGNGPSLDLQDLTLLKDEFTIGANYIFLNREKMGFTPSIVSVVNFLVAQQRAEAFNTLTDTTLVVPFFLRYCIEPRENTFFLDSIPPFEFSIDLTEWISWRSTVTFFNMQLAYYLGFSELYLIGVDHSYVQPKEGKEGALIESTGDDPNHFNKSYFGKGIVWQKADTDSMERVYRLAKEAFENDGRTIFNATAGGKLELFERVDYETLFSGNR